MSPKRQTWNTNSPCGHLWDVCANSWDDFDPEQFKEILTLHAVNGFVEATPDGIILARLVSSKGTDEELNDPSIIWHLDDLDAWLVWGICGKGMLRHFLTHSAYVKRKLPYIGFARAREGSAFAFHPTAQIERLIIGRDAKARETASSQSNTSAS